MIYLFTKLDVQKYIPTCKQEYVLLGEKLSTIATKIIYAAILPFRLASNKAQIRQAVTN